ncbi:MAG: tetratricopeptide repeat protein [Hyphomicrobiales bacterium]|nr:tetratricopeptide repeat protein [Hyphomicrobiales bacterium]
MAGSLRNVLLVLALATTLGGCESAGLSALTGEAASAPASGPSAPAITDLAKGKRQFRDRNFGLAEESFRAAVETRPDNVEGWLGLGAAYDELRRFDLADRAYAQALKLTGPTAQLLNNRGYSHLLRGDYAAARRDLAAARAKDPNNPQIQRNIALLSER